MHALDRITDPSFDILSLILNEPDAVALVQSLDAKTLGKVIRQVGLEESGGLLALATAEQLTELFDDGLWTNFSPGREEQFDMEQFCLWFEVMIQADVNAAARKFIAFEPAFSRMITDRILFVFALEDIRLEMENKPNAMMIDKLLASRPTMELNAYCLIARNAEVWDSMIALLVELDQKYSAWLEEHLEQCRRLSLSQVDARDGLYQVLSASDALHVRAAEQREERRERRGYIAPQDARHFLDSIRRADLKDLLSGTPSDPVTRAYFKSMAEAPLQANITTDAKPALANLLETAGIPSTSLSLPGPDKTRNDLRLLQALNHLQSKDPQVVQTRMVELSYLANVLVSGHSFDNRRILPVEAVRHAMEICQAGLDHLLAFQKTTVSGEDLEQLIREHDLIKLFKIGWKLPIPS